MDEWKTDSAITNYTKISEKDYLVMAIREMSRQYNDKTSGQEIVWKECHKHWPIEYLGPWKNPTSTPKDNVDRLRKKFKFLQENVPPDKFTEDQKKCFELYGRKEIDELSDLLNLIKIREQLKSIRKFMSRVNSASPLVHSQEIMEVETEIRQLCSNDPFNEPSLKRKESTATQEPVKKKRDYSPAFPPSVECNLSHLHFRSILPKETSPEDHLAIRITVSGDHPSVFSSAPKDYLSVQSNQGVTLFSSSNCPASQPNVKSTNIAADHLALASSTPTFYLSVQDNQELTSSSPDLLATPPDVNRTTVSAGHPAVTASTTTQALHPQELVSSSSDKSYHVGSKNEGSFHTFSPQEPSRSIDSGRSSLDTDDEHTDCELLSQDTCSLGWNWINQADQSIQDWVENPVSPALADKNSPLLNGDVLNDFVKRL